MNCINSCTVLKFWNTISSSYCTSKVEQYDAGQCTNVVERRPSIYKTVIVLPLPGPSNELFLLYVFSNVIFSLSYRLSFELLSTTGQNAWFCSGFGSGYLWWISAEMHLDYLGVVVPFRLITFDLSGKKPSWVSIKRAWLHVHWSC